MALVQNGGVLAYCATITKLVCIISLSLLAAFVCRLYRVRSMFRDLTLKHDIVSSTRVRRESN